MKHLALLLSVLTILFFAVACDGGNNGDERPAAPAAPADRGDPWDGDDAYGDDDDDDDTSGEPGTTFDPAAKGPYEVGNTTRIFIDDKHVDLWGNRELICDIWYPAAPETATMPPDTIDQFLGKWYPLVEQIFALLLPAEEVANFLNETRSVRDAPIAEGGPWPVVIFSHGNGGVRFQNMHLCEHLASHGFIVISPDHTGNAAVTPLPRELIIFNPIAMPLEFFWRQTDFSFLIDAAGYLNEFDEQGTFIGKIDAETVALGGHSFGAVTALEAAKYDPRVDAVVSLAGFSFPLAFENYRAPVMCFWGWEDHTLQDLSVVQAMQNYEKIPTTKLWLSVRDAGHYSWTDVCDLVPTLMGNGDGCGEGHRLKDDSVFTFVDNETMYNLMNYYVTAFLAWSLRGDDMWAPLTENIMPEQITYYWTVQ
ncbi:MAG TPA: alpha/beta fold hydrolase [bacterium]|nr:alpha/beta fold hydrolase [bacterium]